MKTYVTLSLKLSPEEGEEITRLADQLGTSKVSLIRAGLELLRKELAKAGKLQ